MKKIILIVFLTLLIAQTVSLEQRRADMVTERDGLIQYNQQILAENQRVILQITNLNYGIAMIDSMLADTVEVD